MVKDTQPTLRNDIELLFTPEYVQAGWSAPAVDFTLAQTIEYVHGRIEERRLTASSLLADYSDWPYLAHIFKLEYRTLELCAGKVTTAVRYGVTSAPQQVLDAGGLLMATRGHWGIETGLHSRRDGAFEEDAMRTRTGQAHSWLSDPEYCGAGLVGPAGHYQGGRGAAGDCLASGLLSTAGGYSLSGTRDTIADFATAMLLPPMHRRVHAIRGMIHWCSMGKSGASNYRLN